MTAGAEGGIERERERGSAGERRRGRGTNLEKRLLLPTRSSWTIHAILWRLLK